MFNGFEIINFTISYFTNIYFYYYLIRIILIHTVAIIVQIQLTFEVKNVVVDKMLTSRNTITTERKPINS